MIRATAGFLSLSLLAGCASTPASVKYVSFPTHGQEAMQQMADQQQCEQIAQHYRGSETDQATATALGTTAVGVATGAAAGAVLGAVAKGASAGSGSIAGLAVGGIVGLSVGIIEGVRAVRVRYERIYGACMSARGYTLGG